MAGGYQSGRCTSNQCSEDRAKLLSRRKMCVMINFMCQAGSQCSYIWSDIILDISVKVHFG